MVGIIFIGDLKYCPYLSKYVEILETNNTTYEVLYWNREGALSNYPDNYISFNIKSKLNRHPIFKIKDFILFRNWLIERISSKKYDKLIILSTLSGVLLSELLSKKYSNKYIFDIRDYSYEHYKMFFKREAKIIGNSYFTCISSKGFRQFLPKSYDYKIVHNFNKNELINSRPLSKKSYGDTLHLTWIGAVRYFCYQKQIIDRLCDDPRFILKYHGSGPQLDEFKKYCKSNNISNVVFTGEYNNEDKAKLLHDADILNNNYKTDKEMEVKYAISNKYYDGLIFSIPQLVETDTFKCELVEGNKIGIGLDPNDECFADKLYEYYFNVDEKNFKITCDCELKKIIEEDSNFSDSIKWFIESQN